MKVEREKRKEVGVLFLLYGNDSCANCLGVGLGCFVVGPILVPFM